MEIKIENNTIFNYKEVLNELKEKFVSDFLLENKYGEYETLLNILALDLPLEDLYDKYYNEDNHYCCGLIYENITNHNKVMEISDEIFERSGFKGLVINYLIIIKFLRWINVDQFIFDIYDEQIHECLKIYRYYYYYYDERIHESLEIFHFFYHDV